MGNTDAKPENSDSINEKGLINIINIHKEQVKHAQKTADATWAIAVIILVMCIGIVLYIIYRVITKFERLKAQQQINHAVSLASVSTSANWKQREQVNNQKCFKADPSNYEKNKKNAVNKQKNGEMQWLWDQTNGAHQLMMKKNDCETRPRARQGSYQV